MEHLRLTCIAVGIEGTLPSPRLEVEVSRFRGFEFAVPSLVSTEYSTVWYGQ